MIRNKELLNRIRGSRPYKAIVRVTLETSDGNGISDFEANIKVMHEIEFSRRLPGKPAYLLFVAVKGQQAFDYFIINKLQPLTGPGRINSLSSNNGLRVYQPHAGDKNQARSPFETIRRCQTS